MNALRLWAALVCIGTLALASSARAEFRRPLACTDCIWDFYFYDHGSFSPQDYDCQGSTYGGHVGSDYSLRGNNSAIDTGYDVVAAAAGTVISTEDGYYDHCTQCGGSQCGLSFGNGFANQVYIDHGTHRAMYGHMRTGSIAVQPGDTVTCGQTIGQVGSSGCSTGAHLHFEPRTTSGRAQPVDPYEGDCSPTEASLWVEQPAHRRLPTDQCGADDPPGPTCPEGTYEIWTCNEARTERRRCIEGVDSKEPCAYGCTAMPTGVNDECAMPPDADGDGSRADVDCDDASAARHPGAVETCGDGIDQDCSGADATCMVPEPGGAGGGVGAAGAAAGGVAGTAAGLGGVSGGASGAAGFAATGGAGGGVGGIGGVGGALAGAGGAFGGTGAAQAPSRTPSSPASCSASGAHNSSRTLVSLALAWSALLFVRRRGRSDPSLDHRS